MKVLVTGAAGFIGMHTSARLLQQGFRVVGIDNLNGYYDPALKRARLERLSGVEGFSCHQVSVEDRGAMERIFAVERPEAVVHLAAQAGVRYSLENPHAYIDSNVSGFCTVLEGCRKQGILNLVYASSSSVYGGLREMPFRETAFVDHPVSLYAATKKANELMAHAYSHLFGIRATGLRFFTVYGPWGRPDMAYYSFAESIVQGRPIRVFNHGAMKRDFTYVDDIVEGVVQCVARPATPKEPDGAPHRVFNIGNQNPVELLEMIALLERLLGRPAIRELLPMQAGDVPATYADVSALDDWIGFRPRTSLESGLERFVEWFRSYHRC